MRKSNSTIEQHAIEFLQQYNSDELVPVPIEEIVEIQLGMDIVPIKGLLREHHIDGIIDEKGQVTISSKTLNLSDIYGIITMKKGITIADMNQVSTNHKIIDKNYH